MDTVKTFCHSFPHIMKISVLQTLFLLSASRLSSCGSKFDYSGYQVVRIEVVEEKDVEAILKMKREKSLCNGCTFDIWSKYGPGIKHLDVLASSSTLMSLQSWSDKMALNLSVLI